MLDAVVPDDDDAQAGLVIAQRFADGGGGDRFNFTIMAEAVAVVMAGEKVFHPELVKQGKVRGAAFARDIEVLVGLVGGI